MRVTDGGRYMLKELRLPIMVGVRIPNLLDNQLIRDNIDWSTVDGLGHGCPLHYKIVQWNIGALGRQKQGRPFGNIMGQQGGTDGHAAGGPLAW